MRVHKVIGKQILILTTKINRLVAKFEDATQDVVKEHALTQAYLQEAIVDGKEKFNKELVDIGIIRDQIEINTNRNKHKETK